MMLLKKGTSVKVISGKDKGKTGEILEIDRKERRLKIKSINMVKRHVKPTKENKGEMAEKTNKKLINVFVPTTPNPTSGFLLMFPIDEVIYLNMTFEEASKFIVSAGTSTGKN